MFLSDPPTLKPMRRRKKFCEALATVIVRRAGTEPPASLTYVGSERFAGERSSAAKADRLPMSRRRSGGNSIER